MMNPDIASPWKQLLDKAERANESTSFTELAEMMAQVREFARGEDPILFLLKNLADQEDKVQMLLTQLRRWDAINEWVQDKDIHAYMIGAQVEGDYISADVLRFLKLCAREWERDLQRAVDREHEEALSCLKAQGVVLKGQK